MTDEELRQLAERLAFLVSLNDPDRGGPYGGHAAEDCMRSMKAAYAAILSLMSERYEANARALNWECRFEAASARGAAAEARIRELSLSELTALGQADENHKRALDAEARLEKAKEALRGLVTANEDWNAAVVKVIGRPPNWTDGYLDEARNVLSDLESRDEAN